MKEIYSIIGHSKSESFDKFYSELCQLSQTCDFNSKGNQMIRDKIVVGIDSLDLRERLLRLREHLTLKKAVDVCLVGKPPPVK